MENCTPRPRLFMENLCLISSEWGVGLEPERRLNNFRVFRTFQLIAESQLHFERSERVKRFTEVSSRRRRPELLQSAKPRRMIQRLVAVCIPPSGSVLMNWIYIRPTRERWKSSVSSTERRLEKENYIFIVSLIN